MRTIIALKLPLGYQSMEVSSPEPERRRALQEWAVSANAAFREGRFRGGRARRAVIELLARQDCCLSATEIFDHLRAEGSSVGLASVYRALEHLVRLGLVQRLDFGDAARYEPILPDGDHHHHVICVACGKVEPFADHPLERALGRLGGLLDYEVHGHDVVLRGSCSDCHPA
jgi:Fur family transcriptional regulator, ferric uptake regulator